jgi:heme oxygenase
VQRHARELSVQKKLPAKKNKEYDEGTGDTWKEHDLENTL